GYNALAVRDDVSISGPANTPLCDKEHLPVRAERRRKARADVTRARWSDTTHSRPVFPLSRWRLTRSRRIRSAVSGGTNAT
ncbi:MAG: hypothetical protein QOC75_1632, partial [Pseudonocardiales bacterium]|nr:hypothetical protein [Pseudonocardiales bacterium]